jgi:drug/metabolite transporter (DMT)-like permease
MSDHAKGIVVTLLAVCVLAPDAVLVRLANMDIWPLLFWRNALASVSMIALTVAIERRRTVATCLASGRLGLLFACVYAVASVAFIASLLLTSAANTLIMLATTPMFSALTSRVFLRDPIRARTLAAVAGCMVGVIILVGGSEHSASLWGDLLGLLTAVMWGSSLTIMRAAPRINWLPALSLSHLISATIGAVMASSLVVSHQSIPFVLAMGLVVYPGTFALLQIAPRFLPAPEIALILQLETILGPALVWLVVGEVPGRHTFVGGSIIITVLAVHSAVGLRQARRAEHCGRVVV